MRGACGGHEGGNSNPRANFHANPSPAYTPACPFMYPLMLPSHAPSHVRLSEYPEFLQRKYLSYLIKTQRQGLLQVPALQASMPGMPPRLAWPSLDQLRHTQTCPCCRSKLMRSCKRSPLGMMPFPMMASPAVPSPMMPPAPHAPGAGHQMALVGGGPEGPPGPLWHVRTREAIVGEDRWRGSWRHGSGG